MKIGVNALGLRPGTSGGAETYFRNLVGALLEQDKENEYLIFSDNKKIVEFIYSRNTPAEVIYIRPSYLRIAVIVSVFRAKPMIFLKLILRRLLRFLLSKDISPELDATGVIGKIVKLDRYGLDVVHFPFTVIDPSFFESRARLVLTVHDIQQEYRPEFFEEKVLSQRNRLYRTSAERADAVIVVSETVKKSLIEKYGIRPEKIVVTYQGCAREFKEHYSPEILASMRKKYKLPTEFMLYPASTWPHKNHIKLLEAIAILRKRYACSKGLILTGLPMNNHTAVMDTIERLEIGDLVKFLRFVPFEHIPIIYSLATILVFPSLFEGFGLPLLEAMCMDLPIACSDRTSIPEIVGDAATYFNPEDENEISEKLFTLWHDPQLREGLVKKGRAQADKFAWEEVIKKTIATYKLATVLG